MLGSLIIGCGGSGDSPADASMGADTAVPPDAVPSDSRAGSDTGTMMDAGGGVLVGAVEGGTVTSPDGLLTLVIPPGALAEDTRIGIALVPEGDLDPAIVAAEPFGAVYGLTPDGLTFSTPATATFSMDSAAYDALEGSDGLLPVLGVSTHSMADGLVELAEPQVSYDLTSRTATLSAEIDHFSSLLKTRRFRGGLVTVGADLGPTELVLRALHSTPLTVFNDSEDKILMTEGYDLAALGPNLHYRFEPTSLEEVPPGDQVRVGRTGWECLTVGAGTVGMRIWIGDATGANHHIVALRRDVTCIDAAPTACCTPEGTCSMATPSACSIPGLGSQSVAATCADSPCVPQCSGTIFNVATEGTVSATSVFTGFTAEMSIDDDLTSSWFSTGPEPLGAPTIYRWTTGADECFDRVKIFNNSLHDNPEWRTGFGFGTVTMKILASDDVPVWIGTFGLEGTPDPERAPRPRVGDVDSDHIRGRTLELHFLGHENPLCGGFGELLVDVLR